MESRGAAFTWRCLLLAAVLAFSGFECTQDRDTDACRNAIDDKLPNRIAACRAAFAAHPDPPTAGLLARALASEDVLDETLKLAERYGDQPGGADAWSAVGSARLGKDDNTGAMAAYQRAVAHRAPDDLAGRVRDAMGLCWVFRGLDRMDEAVEYAGLAYDLVHKADDPKLSGYVLLTVASTMFEINDLPTARKILDEAETMVDASSPYWPSLLNLRGIVALQTGRRQLARGAFTEAVELAQQRGATNTYRVASVTLANMDREDGQVEAARQRLGTLAALVTTPAVRAHHAYVGALVSIALGDFDGAVAAIDDAAKTAPDYWLGSLAAIRGRALFRARHLPEAEAALRDAMARHERKRAEMDLDSLRPWLLTGEWRWPFEDLFQLLVDEGHIDDAFDVTERVTARALLDGLLAPGGVDERADRLGVDVVGANERLAGVRGIARAVRRSASTNPVLGADLRATVGARTLLVYFCAGDAVWLLAVHPRKPARAFRIGDARDLAQRVDDRRQNPDRLDVLDDLGRRLLPDGALPDGDAPIYVVADDLLHDLPFAALRVKDRFLVELHPVALVPSANVLAALAGAPPLTGPPVLLGDPTGDLAGAESEVRDLAASLGTSALTGALATRAELMAASGASLLHVAAHTTTTPRGPALSLADGPFVAGDILDAGIRAGVVVLASCASAETFEVRELGSLAAAFLASGSNAVVASLWAIDDGVAAEFARDFYAGRGASRPVEAVANAQRRMLRSGAPIESWAAFVVFGEDPTP